MSEVARRRARAACLAAAVLAVGLAACQSNREGRLVRPLPGSEEILGQATHVARVRVVSRDPIESAFKSRTVSCGSYYRVEVVDALKGADGGALDFIAEETLELGAEYLVAVRDTGAHSGTYDAGSDWDSERLRCRARFERIAIGVARVQAGEDGLVVADSRMLPERIRQQAVGDAVAWPIVERELFPAAPQAARGVPAPATTEVVPEETDPRPAPQEQEPAEKNRWLPWNWEFEWL